MHCKTCKYWSRKYLGEDESISKVEVKECIKAKDIFDYVNSTQMDISQKLFVAAEYSSYEAALLTKPDFGCIEYERKESE